MPTPVSRDRDGDLLGSLASYDAAIVTEPSGVNLSALLSRFSTICFTFWRSLRSDGTRRAASSTTARFERLMIGSSSDMHLVDQLGDAERRHVQRHPARLDAGDVEDVVDERQQVPRVRVDARQALALRIASPAPVTPFSSMCV